MQQSVRSRMAAGAAAGALVLFFVSGCSSSVGGDEPVKKHETAERASAGPKEEGGRAPGDASCEAGESGRCTVTGGGKSDTDHKSGGGTGRGGAADPMPSASAQPTEAAGVDTGTSGSVDQAAVARQGKAALAAQMGKEPDAFSCPGNLPAEVGATVRCRLTHGGTRYGVTVTAKSVVGGKVTMDFKVDGTPGG
ncbi:DUF4333 domain-containing protein [Streptomyces sp. SAS_281]|uniref:DUF4333 domain-containing protein n=1 Tax=Streptomyces sp. SAS_281 TaxID=3412744 RepID=UPI00403C87D5